MSDAAYLALYADGKLHDRAQLALGRLAACTLCARRCGADRTQGIKRATCQTGRWAKVARWGASTAIGDLAGAAEILFSGCNLRCLACSTSAASWDGEGDQVDGRALADILLELQRRGHGLVMLASPSHVPAQILEALCLAVADGFRLKLAWQSGGYDSLETLALLDGVVDVYVPDFKHGDGAAARVCLGVADYPEVTSAAVAEMYRQVGPGVLVRHLVLPAGLAGSPAVAAALPAGVAVQVLDDYQPRHRANRHPKLNRRPSADEVAAARALWPE